MTVNFKETGATFGCGNYLQSRGTRLFVRVASVGGNTASSKSPMPDSAAKFIEATDFYTQVGRIESLGEFGPDASIGSYSPLDSNVVCKSMGASDYGEMSVTIAKTSDNGLKALVDAQGQSNVYQFVIVPSGATFASSTTSVSTETTVTTTTTTGGVAGDPVEVTTTTEWTAGAPNKYIGINAMVKTARTVPGTGDDIMKVNATLVLMGPAYEVLS